LVVNEPVCRQTSGWTEALSAVVRCGDHRRSPIQAKKNAEIADQEGDFLVVLQEMSRDIKGLTRTSPYTAMLKRLDTNPTCPFLMMFIASYPPMARRAVLKLKKPSPGLTRRFATEPPDTCALISQGSSTVRHT